MALAVALVFTVQDATGRSATTKIRVPNGFSIAQYREAAQAYAQLIADISDGQVTSASACIGLDISAAVQKLAALSLSDAYNKAQYIFNSAVTGFRKLFRIPAINESATISGSNSIDQSLAAQQALIDAMTVGLTTLEGTMQPVSHRGQDLTSLSSAVETFRRK